MDKNISNHLKKLIDIQEIDTNLGGIIKLRGTLPEEVNELIQDIEKLSTEKEERTTLLATLEHDMLSNKEFVKQTENKVLKYESQQMEVRNNREYDAITNELELHKLDIQLANKFLSTAYEKLAQETSILEDLHTLLAQKKIDLELKKKELETILQATETEEDALNTKRAAIVSSLDPLLYLAYEKTRTSVSNNLAVVPIKKNACAGCCIVIPPQQRLSVYECSKVVICEYCGRMLIVPEGSMDIKEVI
ncbi:MAG: hypothetical protein K2X94_02550 [Amoebophilaceae bacterium]|nr:hypothetical protein [Amoebophilaceae bacterium]